MKDENFGLLAVILLGLVQMFGFFGYEMMGFLVEPICHSVRQQCPDCIIDFAGYYGNSLINLSYTIGNLIAPCFLPILGAKGFLLLASAFWLIYAMSFLYLRTWLFFPACLLIGIGFSMFYSGGGSYALRHSTDRTLSRNQSIQCMIGSLTTFMGGLFLILSNQMLVAEGFNDDFSVNENQTHYRHYSDTEIRLLSIGMSIFALIALILSLLLPKRELSNSLQKKIKDVSLKQQIGKVFSAIREKQLLKLAPFFSCTGFFLATVLTLYPTTFAFTDSLVKHRNLVAYYSLAMTLGEVIVGLMIASVCKKYPNFGLAPLFSLACTFFTSGALLALFFTPAESSLRPTKEISIFEPNEYICLLVGVLFGAMDGCATTSRMTAAAKALPEEPAIAFSVAKFYQAAASMVILSLGALLNLHQLLYLIIGLLLISICCYISFLRDLIPPAIINIEKSEKSFNEKK